MSPCLRIVPSTSSTTEVRMNRCSENRSTSLTPTEVPMKKPRRRVLTPKSVFHGLAQELDLLGPTYAKLQVAHSALSPYPTLASLLARLTTAPRDDAKKELLAALIVIRQSDPHRLWVAILLRAFRPMLAKIWKELFGSDTQERLALLLLSFQAAVAHVDACRDPVRIAMYVRQGTRRRAIVALSKELRWNDMGFGEEADECSEASEAQSQSHPRTVRPLLRAGALHAHVRRAHPTLSAEEQTREYQKLRRRVRRALRAPSARLEDGAVTR